MNLLLMGSAVVLCSVNVWKWTGNYSAGWAAFFALMSIRLFLLLYK